MTHLNDYNFVSFDFCGYCDLSNHNKNLRGFQICYPNLILCTHSEDMPFYLPQTRLKTILSGGEDTQE